MGDLELPTLVVERANLVGREAAIVNKQRE